MIGSAHRKVQRTPDAWADELVRGASADPSEATFLALAARYPKELAALDGMINRCTNPSDKDYKFYGARGITVHPAWRKSQGGFATFLRDVGAAPCPTDWLVRKDVNGPFAPGNVHWVEKRRGATAKRTCRFITVDGVTLTGADWSRKMGLPHTQTVTNRMNDGWHPEAAVKGLAGETKAAAHARLGLTPTKNPKASGIQKGSAEAQRQAEKTRARHRAERERVQRLEDANQAMAWVLLVIGAIALQEAS